VATWGTVIVADDAKPRKWRKSSRSAWGRLIVADGEGQLSPINWSDYQAELEKMIEDIVLAILVEVLSKDKHTKDERLPITSNKHPWITENPRYSKLPPE
jgi:hypothetical protein